LEELGSWTKFAPLSEAKRGTSYIGWVFWSRTRGAHKNESLETTYDLIFLHP